MKGARGEVAATMIKAFNDSQSDYVVVGAYKGNYDETINAGVAAYRAKKAAAYHRGLWAWHRNDDAFRCGISCP